MSRLAWNSYVASADLEVIYTLVLLSAEITTVYHHACLHFKNCVKYEVYHFHTSVVFGIITMLSNDHML